MGKRCLLILFTLLVTVNLSMPAESRELSELSSDSTIGIIAAMEVEVEHLRTAMGQVQTEKHGGIEFYSGTIGRHRVVLSRCGVGKVNAAMGTQAMIDHYSPACIINTGCAGGLKSGIKVGDIVLSTFTAEWDMDTTVFGDPRGYFSVFDGVSVKADEGLRSSLKRYVPAQTKAHEGLLLSGDQFVHSEQQRAIIRESFPEAYCVEMEGAAVGHVCLLNEVPFCVVRCMSDTADGQSSVDYGLFVKEAGAQSAQILIDMIMAE